MITPLNSQPIDQAMVEAAIKRMEKYGSYYRSLEKALGAGASLALGNNVSEDVWMRGVTKRGKRKDDVIAHLRNTELSRLAKRYGGLRVHLVNFQLQRFGLRLQQIPTSNSVTEVEPDNNILQDQCRYHDNSFNLDPMLCLLQPDAVNMLDPGLYGFEDLDHSFQFDWANV